MIIASFVYALHACLASYPQSTVFVDLFDCNKTKGRICYLSTQYENWRPDSKQFPKEALGKPLGDWPGERLVDNFNPKVMEIMLKRMDLAKSKGCAGIDPDNVDQAKNPVKLVQWLSIEARKRGLLVGLKNYSEKAKSLSSLVDFHVVEECTKFKECDKYPLSKSFFIEYSKKKDSICKERKFTIFADKELRKFEFCN